MSEVSLIRVCTKTWCFVMGVDIGKDIFNTHLLLGWTTKWVDRRDLEKIWKKNPINFLLFPSNHSVLSFLLFIFPLKLYILMTVHKKNHFSQESPNNLILLVGFCCCCCCFYGTVNYIQKKGLNLYFGGKLSNFIMTTWKVIWNSLSNVEQGMLFFFSF